MPLYVKLQWWAGVEAILGFAICAAIFPFCLWWFIKSLRLCEKEESDEGSVSDGAIALLITSGVFGLASVIGIIVTAINMVGKIKNLFIPEAVAIQKIIEML